MANETVSVLNYLVPAAGTPSAMPVELTLVAGVAQNIDFRTKQLDGQSFSPYGVLIDNTDGTAVCTVEIDGIGWTIRCPIGEAIQAKYPGPVQQSVTVNGEGVVKFVFVNYPL